MKRLVLLVEGDGDVQAVPSLVGSLLTQLPEDNCFSTMRR
jgi:hypothetical protein